MLAALHLGAAALNGTNYTLDAHGSAHAHSAHSTAHTTILFVIIAVVAGCLIRLAVLLAFLPLLRRLGYGLSLPGAPPPAARLPACPAALLPCCPAALLPCCPAAPWGGARSLCRPPHAARGHASRPRTSVSPRSPLDLPAALPTCAGSSAASAYAAVLTTTTVVAMVAPVPLGAWAQSRGEREVYAGVTLLATFAALALAVAPNVYVFAGSWGVLSAPLALRGVRAAPSSAPLPTRPSQRAPPNVPLRTAPLPTVRPSPAGAVRLLRAPRAAR